MKKRLYIALLFSMFQMFFCRVSTRNPGYTRVWSFQTSWIVSPAQALELSEKGGVWIDTRSSSVVDFPLLGEFLNLSWKDFSSEIPKKGGNLKSKERILEILAEKKIDIRKPLLVMGDAQNGWGEEGRIVWMLRSIGIPNSFIVDGGMDALLALKSGRQPASDSLKNLEWKDEGETYTISSEELVSLNGNKDHILIDTREKREYDGETPYGEERGGHIPGAKWLYYKDLLDSEGFILPREKIVEKLRTIGYRENQTIISYCTGGVRSAFVTAILVSYGFNAKNYAGSMWEYTSLRSEDGFLME